MIDLFDMHVGRMLRDAPSNPVIRHTTETGGDPPLRLVVSRIWNLKRPILCWVLFRPVADERDTGLRRIIRWSYRGHYGGVIITSLYPLIAGTRSAVDTWRKDESLKGTGQFIEDAAGLAGAACRRFRVRTVVLATGDLDAAASEDLAHWLAAFRDEALRSKFLALELTLAGWPVAPALSGRRQPPEEMALVPWKFPAVTRPGLSFHRRRSAGAPC